MCRKVLEPSIPEIELSIDEIYATYVYFYSPTFAYPGEVHEPWELIFVNSGEVIIETPEYEKKLSKGQAFIHIPDEFHKIKANNVPCNVHLVSFKCSCEKLYGIAQKVLDISPTHKQYLFSIINEGQMYLAGKNYVPPHKNKPPFAGGQLVKYFTEILLIGLIRQNENEAPIDIENDITVTQNPLIDYVIKYLNRNLQKKLKLEEIAHEIGYSVPRICSLFKKATGVSIINYLIRLRINVAKQLIAEGKMSLREISEHLNFDSVQYFSSQFKKITTVTPSQYAAYLKINNFHHSNADDFKIL